MYIYNIYIYIQEILTDSNNCVFTNYKGLCFLKVDLF